MPLLHLLALPVLASEPTTGHATAENIVAARFAGGALSHDGGAEPVTGAGLAAEHVFRDGNVVEITASALSAGETTEIPVELLFEHTWHAGHYLEPFAGVGPSVVVHSLDGEREVSFGAVGAVGTHVWLGPHWGLLAEVDVTLDTHESVVLGSEVLVGPVFHWE